MIVLVLLTTISSTPCTDADARATPGRWLKAEDDLAAADKSISKEQKKKLLEKADGVVRLIKNIHPELTGIDAKVYRSIRGEPYVKDGAIKFGVQSLYLSYYCVPNKGYSDEVRGKVQPGGETGTWFYVTFNGLEWLANERMRAGDLKSAKNQTVLYVPPQKGTLKGHALLQPNIHNGRRREEAMIIAPEGKSPYTPFSREDYLRANIALRQQAREEREKSHEKEVSTREASLARAKSDEEREKLRRRHEGWDENFRTQLAKIDGEIAALEKRIEELSPEERAVQAVVKSPFADAGGRLFFSESEGGRALATIDRRLFDAKGAREAIRVITLYWTWDEDAPAKVAAIAKLKEDFDFAALAALVEP